MLTIKKYLLLILGFLFVLSGQWQPVSVSAQSTTGLEWVNVTLWPEQGESSVLIVYEIHLSETLNYPQEVAFPIPADCEVKKISIQRNDGELLPVAWDIHEEGDWQLVHFAAISPVTRLEYRDSSIAVSNSSRQFSFEWVSNAEVESFSLTVYQPFGASELETEPSLTQMEVLDDGRKVYSKNFGRMSSDELVWLDLQYEKDITNPDYPALSVSAVSPLNDSVIGHSATPLSVVVWLAAVAVVVMIMVVIYYWWINRRMQHKREHIVRGVGILNPEKQAVFCHECGSRSKAGDAYCRSCGTELRRF